MTGEEDMKIKIIIFGLLSVTLLAACSNNKEVKENKTQEVLVTSSPQPKYAYLAEDLKQLNEMSSLIIIATKISEKESSTDLSTMSKLEINKVVKDEIGLNKAETIQLSEDNVSDSKIDRNNGSDYKRMENGKEYILFLNKDKSEGEYFFANGPLSKFPLKKVSESELSEENTLNDTYTKIYSEVLQQY